MPYHALHNSLFFINFSTICQSSLCMQASYHKTLLMLKQSSQYLNDCMKRRKIQHCNGKVFIFSLFICRAAFMCGREPNFELPEEEKRELSKFKWDEFLAMTRQAITRKSNLSMNNYLFQISSSSNFNSCRQFFCRTQEEAQS